MIDPKKLIIFLLCLGNITISFNAGAVAAAIPIIADGLSQSDVLVSRVVSYYMVPYGLGALLYAPLTRYWSYQKILIGAMALYAVASFASGEFEYTGFVQRANTGRCRGSEFDPFEPDDHR